MPAANTTVDGGSIARMGRSLLYVVAGGVVAWVGADLLYQFLRVSDSYGRLFLF